MENGIKPTVSRIRHSSATSNRSNCMASCSIDSQSFGIFSLGYLAVWLLIDHGIEHRAHWISEKSDFFFSIAIISSLIRRARHLGINLNSTYFKAGRHQFGLSQYKTNDLLWLLQVRSTVGWLPKSWCLPRRLCKIHRSLQLVLHNNDAD